MAVFPDRIVLKNSTDSDAAIRTAIQTGGTDEILRGELVVGLGQSSLVLYSKDSNGDIISFSPTSAAARVIVSETEPTIGINSQPLVDGDLWYQPGTNTFYVYESSTWKPIGGSSVVIVSEAEPTEQPNGQPLSEGNLWYQPSANALYIYESSAWQQISGQDLYINDLFDVDTETTPPEVKQTLVWDGTNWVPGTASVEVGRGDGGNFDTTTVDAAFVFGVYGGGDFDSTTADEPVELEGFADGGDFL